MAFMFLLEFCLSVNDINITFSDDTGDVSSGDANEKLQVLGLNRNLPGDTDSFKSYLADLHLNMLQIIDRIASTQIGADRVLCNEYLLRILPNNTFLDDPVRAMLEMNDDGIVPDTASLDPWRPLLDRNMVAVVEAPTNVGICAAPSGTMICSGEKRQRKASANKKKEGNDSPKGGSPRKRLKKLNSPSGKAKVDVTNSSEDEGDAFPPQPKKKKTGNVLPKGGSPRKPRKKLVSPSGKARVNATNSSEQEGDAFSPQPSKGLKNQSLAGETAKVDSTNSSGDAIADARIASVHQEDSFPLPPRHRLIADCSSAEHEEVSEPDTFVEENHSPQLATHIAKSNMPAVCSKDASTSPPIVAASRLLESATRDPSRDAITNHAASITTQVEMGSFMAGLSDLLPLFKDTYNNSTSEDAKDRMRWSIFKLLHDTNPSAFVNESMDKISNALEVTSEEIPREEQPDSAEDENRELILVLCGRAMVKPESYLERTREFLDEFNEASSISMVEEGLFLERMYNILRKERFRLHEPIVGDAEGWQEMSFKDGIDTLRKRMRLLQQRGHGNGRVKGEKIDTTSLENMHFAVSPVIPEGPLAPTHIVEKQNDTPNLHFGNKVFRNQVIELARICPQYMPATEKKRYFRKPLDALARAGFTFVTKGEFGWRALTEKETMSLTLKRIREHYSNNDRKDKPESKNNSEKAKARVVKKKAPKEVVQATSDAVSHSTSQMCTQEPQITPRTEGLPVCGDVMNDVSGEDHVLDELESGPQVNLLNFEVASSTNNEEGFSCVPTEDTSGQGQLALLSSVLENLTNNANRVNNTQDTYIFDENDSLPFNQDGRIVDLTQPPDEDGENQPYDAHDADNDP